jgi:hypothetical protein
MTKKVRFFAARSRLYVSANFGTVGGSRLFALWFVRVGKHGVKFNHNHGADI